MLTFWRVKQNIENVWMMGYKLRQLMWSLEDWDRIQSSFEMKGR